MAMPNKKIKTETDGQIVVSSTNELLAQEWHQLPPVISTIQKHMHISELVTKVPFLCNTWRVLSRTSSKSRTRLTLVVNQAPDDLRFACNEHNGALCNC